MARVIEGNEEKNKKEVIETIEAIRNRGIVYPDEEELLLECGYTQYEIYSFTAELEGFRDLQRKIDKIGSGVFVSNGKKEQEVIRIFNYLDKHKTEIFGGAVELKLELHTPATDGAVITIQGKGGLAVKKVKEFTALISRAAWIEYSAKANDDVTLELTFYGLATKISD